MADEAQRLQAMTEAPDAAQPGLGHELRALALISLGITEVWAARFEDAERHLEQGITLAHRIGRPFLEFSGLAHQAVIETFRSSLRGRRSAACRRSSWPGGTAGPMSRPQVSRT